MYSPNESLFYTSENPRVSSSEEEAGQQMVNISLFSTGPDVLYSFPATEMRDHQEIYPRSVANSTTFPSKKLVIKN